MENYHMLLQETSRYSSETDEHTYIRLEKDGWNDYGYETLYRMSIKVDKTWKSIGKVRISSNDEPLVTNLGAAPIERLGDDFFSLGSDENYYESLADLGLGLKRKILEKLNDVTLSTDLYESVKDKHVFRTSLMRGKNESDYKSLRKYALDETNKSNFSLEYSVNCDGEDKAEIKFQVINKSLPPSNIHAIIGSNGVGKSTLLRNIVRNAIQDPDAPGVVKILDENGNPSNISKLIFISYSAFDDHSLADKIIEMKKSLDVKYISLKINQGSLEGISTDEDLIDDEYSEATSATKSNNSESLQRDLSEDFIKTMFACSQGYRWERWKKAIDTLQTDSIFREIEAESFKVDDQRSAEFVKEKFEKLSSGHAISILIISKLIMQLRERCVVLIDEPESHLHPPLLAALLNAISDVVTDRNGIAILTTHSPVVLQEIPASCVWVITRNGHNLKANRPRIETYGENLSEITREVFRLEVHKSGFHKTLMNLIDEGLTYDEICDRIPKMGSEARAIAMALAD